MAVLQFVIDMPAVRLENQLDSITRSLVVGLDSVGLRDL
jgi:hypothetical protein